MRSLLTELNKIYVKLGGNESDIPVDKREDTTYVLRQIYFKLGGEESDIPSYKVNDVEYLIDKIEDKVGGGGSSDFSTAKVTVEAGAIANGILLPSIAYVDETYFCFPQTISDAGEYYIVLYKGGAVILTNSSIDGSITGLITKIDECVYLVTGDCVIAGSIN